jgi:hypothetical protein
VAGALILTGSEHCAVAVSNLHAQEWIAAQQDAYLEEGRRMYRKILIGGMTAAAIVGAGGTALALAGADTINGAPATTVSHTVGKHPRFDIARMRHLVHGQVVTKGKNGFVTHDFIVGAVTAVSASSISVRADDNVSETFVVNGDTKVRVLGDGVRGLSSIDKIKTGDRVGVAGTGTSTFTAKRVVKLPS